MKLTEHRSNFRQGYIETRIGRQKNGYSQLAGHRAVTILLAKGLAVAGQLHLATGHFPIRRTR